MSLPGRKADVSLPEWLRCGLKNHCTRVRMASNPIADTRLADNDQRKTSSMNEQDKQNAPKCMSKPDKVSFGAC